MLFKDERRLGRMAWIEYGSRSDQPDALIVRRRFYERPRLVRSPRSDGRSRRAQDPDTAHRRRLQPQATFSSANRSSGETNALTVAASDTKAYAMGRRLRVERARQARRVATARGGRCRYLQHAPLDPAPLRELPKIEGARGRKNRRPAHVDMHPLRQQRRQATARAAYRLAASALAKPSVRCTA